MTTGVDEPEVEIWPAATVILVRPAEPRLEVLLTARPTTMAFAAGMHVFPGGRVDPTDGDPALVNRSVLSPAEAVTALGGDIDAGPALAAHIAAIRELFEEAGVLLADHTASDETVNDARSALLRGGATLPSIAQELDLRLRTDRLIPISRWVTPAGMTRRFDARFFVAELPDGAEVSFEGDEVAGHEWIRPADGLRAMADGRLRMWLPTSTSLQQLDQARTIDDVRTRMTPQPSGPTVVEIISPDVTRIVLPAAAGVSGQPISTYLIGRRRFIVVDPGDPSPEALARVLAIARDRDGAIEAVVLTHVDAGHAAGAQGFADALGIPILTGPGGGRPLPYPVSEPADGERLSWTDVAVDAIHAPGPRPDHMALIVAGGTHVISGDLRGIRGARSIPGPADEVAWAGSVERLSSLAPGADWLDGHPGR